jgi:uncharacterized damage-inducible protein DinB
MATTETIVTAIEEQMAAYFTHMAARIERFVRQLTHEQLWHKPFAFGNSVGHIVVHLTGNLNHYIGAGIAGTAYTRNRPLEFTTSEHPPADELLHGFHSALTMVLQTLRTQQADDLLTPLPLQQEPVQNHFGLFLVCLAHLNNHIGQIVYLLQAHGIQFDERSW